MTTSPKDALELAEGVRQHLRKCPHGMNCHAPHSQLEAIVCLADSLISAHKKLKKRTTALREAADSIEIGITWLHFHGRPSEQLKNCIANLEMQAKRAREALKEIEE